MQRIQRTTVVGVFDNAREAQKCAQELKRMGFQDTDIGVASPDRDREMTNGGTKDTYAAEGAVTGALAGAGLGAAWGIGIAAGVLPVIGPVIAGGTLAAVLASAALGGAAASIAGALIGMGIPEDEAKHYEEEFKSGRTIVSVKAGSRYDEAAAVIRRFGGHAQNQTGTFSPAAWSAESRTPASSSSTASPARSSSVKESTQNVQLREEELRARKNVEAGEVNIRKEVHTEHKTLEVPVQREEVVIERRPASGQPAQSGAMKSEEIRIPVKEEHVHVEKTPVVKEDVHVSKRTVQDTEKVSGTVKKEELKVDRKGDVNVKGAPRDSSRNK